MPVAKTDYARVLDEDQAWIHRDFLKEKLRVRERYWRYLSSTSDTLLSSSVANTSSLFLLLPDGLTWRKYLPLFTKIVEQTSQCHFVLLESAVECMDYRNSSPCIPGIQGLITEATAVQERSKIRQLLEHYPTRVAGFCDLSVRWEDQDEWDLMDFDQMTTLERCHHALLRASSMLLQMQPHDRCRKVLAITSDLGFLEKFTPDDGVEVLEVDQFLARLEMKDISGMTPDSLIELKARCDESYQFRNSPLEIDGSAEKGEMEYLTENMIQQGLRNKTLVKGRLNVSKENPKEGYVVATSIGQRSEASSYFIDQKARHFNRAIHQDVVVLQPLDKAQWKRPVGRRRLVHYRDDDDDGTDKFKEDIDGSPPVPSARVVAIAEASRRQFIATLVDLPMNDESACIVVPMDIRIPKIRIKTNTWRRFIGKRLLVQIDAWDVDNAYPAGHCVDIVGPVADLETEIQCLLYENQLHLDPFSQAALACLPPEGHNYVIPSEEIDRRLDLRSTHRIFSVDPPGCQDIDDTMHAQGKNDLGGMIVSLIFLLPQICRDYISPTER